MPFNFYNPYQQPAMPQQIPCPMPTGLQGKLVNNFQEITIGDIPTDGTAAFFIKSDLSEIQTRKWSDDGRVISSIFRPLNAQATNSSTEEKQSQIDATAQAQEALMKRFDDIEEQIAKLMPRTRARKDDE